MFQATRNERVEDERQTFIPVEIAAVYSIFVSNVEMQSGPAALPEFPSKAIT